MGCCMAEWSEGPAYREVVDGVRAQIRDGKLRPGQKLPSIPKLESEYSTTEGVVRRALTELRAEGLISSHQGKGSFVRDDAAVGRSAEYTALAGLIDDLQERMQAIEDSLARLEQQQGHRAAH